MDSLILNFVEHYSHRVQRFTGYDCFKQAEWVIYFMSLCMFLSLSSVLAKEGDLPTDLTNWTLITLLYFYFDVQYTRWIFKKTYSPGFRNPEAKSMQGRRIVNMGVVVIFTIMLSFVPFSLRSILIELTLLGTVLYQYLISCTPLPPGTGKFREWLRELKKKTMIRTAPQGA